MSDQINQNVNGKGAPDADLNAADFRSILGAALMKIPSGSKVLAIISDKTHDDNTPELFPLTAEMLAEKTSRNSMRSSLKALIRRCLTRTNSPKSVRIQSPTFRICKTLSIPIETIPTL